MFRKLLPFVGLGLLLLPLAELLAIITLSQWIGWWMLVWLALSGLAGLLVLKSWRAATAWAVVDSIKSGEVPIRRLFWVARTLVAALLFVFPGPVSDVLGLILILPVWPSPKAFAMPGMAGMGGAQPANDGVYEGEFSRVDEIAGALPPGKDPR